MKTARSLHALLATALVGALLILSRQSCCAQSVLPEQSTPKEVYSGVLQFVTNSLFDDHAVQVVQTHMHDYEGLVKTLADAHKFINKVLGLAGDPYTRYLDAEQTRELRRSLNGNETIAGVGIVFEKGDVYPLVAEVLTGSPAEKGGIAENDVILAVDGTNAKGMDLDRLTGCIRGKIGTRVVLRISRGRKQFNVTLTRASVTLPLVTTKMLSQRIGYLRLRSFADIMPTVVPFEKALLKFQQEEAQGLIVDLRNNPGGYVQTCLQLASLFLEEGTLVSTKSRSENGAYNTVSYVLTPDGIVSSEPMDRQPYIWDKPVIVLVNGHSASAAEMFTAALRDNHRAVVVGTQSFGKGVGQIGADMPQRTLLLVTNFRYYTPNGTWLGDGVSHKIGVSPDIVVEADTGDRPGSAQDAQLQAAIQALLSQVR